MQSLEQKYLELMVITGKILSKTIIKFNNFLFPELKNDFSQPSGHYMTYNRDFFLKKSVYRSENQKKIKSEKK